MQRALQIIVSVLLGAAISTVGAVSHRSIPPFGVILSVLLVLMATLFVRTWGSWAAVVSFAVPYVLLTYLFTRQGPGGSLLIAADGLGYWWLYGGAGAIVVACVVPRRMLGGGLRVTDA